MREKELTGIAVEVEGLVKFELGDNKYSLMAQAASYEYVNVGMHQYGKGSVSSIVLEYTKIVPFSLLLYDTSV